MKRIAKQITCVFSCLFSYNSSKIVPLHNTNTIKEVSTLEREQEFLLNKKLQHLEYINYLESNITEERLSFIPLEFLMGFEDYKLKYQISTINVTKALLLKH